MPGRRKVRIDGRVPGLRDPPEILIFIDENKARRENMAFDYDSSLGTWKTKGLNGVIRPWFFQKVVDQRKGPTRGNVLFQSKEDPMMHANVIKGTQKPHYLIHATYWENVFGIMKEGIVPAKNPTSAARRNFKGLLQGAEGHIYTVDPSASSAPMQRRFSDDFRESAPQGAPPRRFSEDCIGQSRTRRHSEDDLSLSLGARRRKFSEDSVGPQRKEPEAVPEAVPEDEELEGTTEGELEFTLEKQLLGMERPPDAFFVIDMKRAEELGYNLSLIQSSDRDETVFVQGTLPPEILTIAEANDPVNLPEALKAKIVDPRSFNDIPIINLQQDAGGQKSL